MQNKNEFIENGSAETFFDISRKTSEEICLCEIAGCSFYVFKREYREKCFLEILLSFVDQLQDLVLEI